MFSPSSNRIDTIRRCTTFFLSSLACALPTGISQARELKVGGSEAGSYSTIRAAINAAQPGDVILLSPRATPYTESAVFHNKNGSPDKPIVLDGQGATLDGSEPLKATEWTQVEPGLYRSTALPQRLRLVNSIRNRYFFIFNNTLNRMGGASKTHGPQLKKPAELGANEWTYAEADKAFYIRLAPGTALEAVRVPVRASGVAVNGDCSHLRIRNLTAQRVWNDGFNIHGKSRDVSFENIRALDCGDDGISAHDDCQIKVDGMLSRNNATGFCHVNQSQSDSRNIIVEDCLSYGIYLLNDSHHTIRNCIVRMNRSYALRLTQKTTVQMENVLFDGAASAPPPTISIESGAKLQAAHLAAWNQSWKIDGASVQLYDSAIASPKPVDLKTATAWEADRNLWDVPEIHWRDRVFPGADFAGYTTASAQDKNSRASPSTRDALLAGETTSGIKAAELPEFPSSKRNDE